VWGLCEPDPEFGRAPASG